MRHEPAARCPCKPGAWRRSLAVAVAEVEDCSRRPIQPGEAALLSLGIRSYSNLPLRAGGQTIGAFSLLRDRPAASPPSTRRSRAR